MGKLKKDVLDHKNYIIVPAFDNLEVLPHGYFRMMGGKPYLSRFEEAYQQIVFENDILVLTNIAGIEDYFTDNVSVKHMDYDEFANYLFDDLIKALKILRHARVAVVNINCLQNTIGIICNHINAFFAGEINCGGLCSKTDSKDTLFCSTFRDLMQTFFLMTMCHDDADERREKEYLNELGETSFIIRTSNDWLLADRLLSRKKIIFRTNGYIELGLGHVYNCITLAYSMYEHNICIIINDYSKEGITKVRDSGIPYRIIHEESEIDGIIDEFKPDIWVNDCLDTDIEYIKHLKQRVKRVVTIEDLGSGTSEADAVINALYDSDMLDGYNVYSGWRYVCLRDEFQVEERNAYSNEVKKILVMFGGTDPTNYNGILYSIINDIADDYREIEFHFIVGIGYDAKKHGLVTKKEKRIYVHANVQRVTRHMRGADVAITSQGRTIFELAAMGIPAIVLSQNKREATHRFAQMENGFLNLGTNEDINGELIRNTLHWLIRTPIIRKNMYELMKKYPLRAGLHRVKDIILEDAIEGME